SWKGLRNRSHAENPLPASQASGVSMVDASGFRVTVHQPPKRVITLAPSLSEMAAQLLRPEEARLVGVSDFSDTPRWVGQIDRVGPYHRVNLEKILSLAPDLVLATTDGNSKFDVEQLREWGVRVLVVRTENLSQVKESFEWISKALFRETQGVALSERFNQELMALKNCLTGNPRILLQVG